MRGVKPSSWGDIKTCCGGPEGYRVGCLFIFVCSECFSLLTVVLDTDWWREGAGKLITYERTKKRNDFAPRRLIVSIDRKQRGPRQGSYAKLTLSCGHVVKRQDRPTKPAPTAWTRCEVCKKEGSE